MSHTAKRKLGKADGGETPLATPGVGEDFWNRMQGMLGGQSEKIKRDIRSEHEPRFKSIESNIEKLNRALDGISMTGSSDKGADVNRDQVAVRGFCEWDC